MRRAALTLALAAALTSLSPSKAFATYLTIENIWTSAPVLVPNLGGPISYFDVWFRTDVNDPLTSVIMRSSDYLPCTLPGCIPLDVTRTNPIGFAQVFTSPLLTGVPEDVFYFYSLGVGGYGWFTGADDVNAPYVIQPGVAGHDTVHAMWPWPDPAPVENPYFAIATIRFHPGAPPAPVTDVHIRIKPGGEEPSINIDSAGVIPVAILSSAIFDATQVSPATVSLAGAKVKLIGKADRYSCAFQDVDTDGRIDLLCHVSTAAFILEPGESLAVLEAETFDGQPIRGEQAVRIVR